MGRIYRKCKKPNHYTSNCKSRINFIGIGVDNNRDPSQGTNRGGQQLGSSSANNNNNYMLGSINEYNNRKVDTLRTPDIWHVNVRFLDFNNVVNFKLDTGADVNAVPFHIFQKFKFVVQLTPCRNDIDNYSCSPLKIKGKFSARVQLDSQSKVLDFVVIETLKPTQPVSSKYAIDDFKLLIRPNNLNINGLHINLNGLISENKQLFEGVGKIKIEPYNFKLRPNAKPTIAFCRRVPFALRDKLSNELKLMKTNGIIAEMNEPSDFVSPIVIVRKPNNQVRICLDPLHLNKAIIREPFELPNFEELTHDLTGSTVFSVLDESKGFWQIPLSEQASKLTTFVTPFGRYRFLRLPYGLANAPEIYSRAFTDLFKGIKGIKIYMDDIIIYAKNENKHNEIFKTVLQRAKETGVRFNKSKCKFLLTEIKYVGHVITKDGIKPDPNKIEAFKQIQTPKNEKELSQFLGMVTYLSKFINNLSELTKNLRKLTKKDVVFNWTIHKI